MRVCYHDLRSEPQNTLLKGGAKSLGTQLVLIAGKELGRRSKNQAGLGNEAATEMTADADLAPVANSYLL